MKSLLPSASFLVLLVLAVAFVRASAPAQAAQANPAPVRGAEGLEARVATLESELGAERQRHDETRALLEQTITYLEQQSKAAEALLGVLDESEKQGFAVGENWQSRQTMLAGLRTYWSGQQSGVPKLPARPAAPKPALPQRSARK